MKKRKAIISIHCEEISGENTLNSFFTMYECKIASEIVSCKLRKPYKVTKVYESYESYEKL